MLGKASRNIYRYRYDFQGDAEMRGCGDAGRRTASGGSSVPRPFLIPSSSHPALLLLGEERILEQVPRARLRLRMRIDVDADALHLSARIRSADGPVREAGTVRVEGLDEVLEVALHRP